MTMELHEKSKIQRELESVNDLVHDPRRLTILNILSGLDSADYTYLRGIMGLTSGNLSRHLARLEEAGLIKIKKEFVLKRPRTRLRITDAGKTALEEHWSTLKRLRDDARRTLP